MTDVVTTNAYALALVLQQDGQTAGTIIGLAIAAIIAVWVAMDANKRGMNGFLWGLGVFLLCIVFLPIYLIVRRGKSPQAAGGGGPFCPSCGKQISDANAPFCPHCGYRRAQ